MNKFIKRAACPSCQSEGRDKSGNNLAVYKEPTGKYNAYCFACRAYYGEWVEGRLDNQVSRSAPAASTSVDADLLNNCPSISLLDRNIPQEITNFYGVKSLILNDVETTRAYPVKKKGKIVGYKVRVLPKMFSNVGDVKGKTDFFGQSLFNPTRTSTIIITEGEEDALAVYRMAKVVGREVAAVSGCNGISNLKKEIQANYMWLNQFAEVIFCLDTDGATEGVAEECAKLLNPRKVRIATLPVKDASEMCVAHQYTEFWDAIDTALGLSLQGVSAGQDLFEEIRNGFTPTLYKWPKSWGVQGPGFFTPSIVSVAAGTGSGKSSLVKNLHYHMRKTYPDVKVGVITLEESKAYYCKGLLGIELKKRIVDPEITFTEDEFNTAFTKVLGDNCTMADCRSINSEQDLYSVIRYIAQAGECKIIFIDHITQLLALLGYSENKNTLTETIMANLTQLTIELDICIMILSQLRKRSGGKSEDSFELGAMPNEDDIIGSKALSTNSLWTLMLVRNKLDETNTSRLVTLKDRLMGYVGWSNSIKYDPATGLMD